MKPGKRLYYTLAGEPTNRPPFYVIAFFRPPKKGEFYLSGAIPEVWQAMADLKDAYWIMAKSEAEPEREIEVGGFVYQLVGPAGSGSSSR